jgi:hypothetical protein
VSLRDPESGWQRLGGWRFAAPLAAFVAFALLCTSASLRSSATYDEPYHLAAGAAVLALGDYRIDAEHPPLARVWAALPTVLAGTRPDPKDEAFARGDTWTFGPRFLAAQEGPERALLLARMMNLAWAFLLMFVLWDWARALRGELCGALVLGLAVLEPNLLAHAGVVGTDFPLAVLVTLTLRACWDAARRISTGAVLQLAVGFSAALLTKTSGLAVGPTALAWLLLRALRADRWEVALGPLVRTLRTRKARLGAVAAMAVAMVVVAWAGIWLAYGLRWAPTPGGPGIVLKATPEDLASAPAALRLLDRIEAAHLLPNAYVQGMIHSSRRMERRRTYLLGEVSDHASWLYFPLAFGAKTPLTLLLLFGLGLVACLRRPRALLDGEGLLLMWLALFGAAALRTNLQIGLRHVLPVYPAVILVAGAGVAWLLARLPRGAVAALLLALALEVGAVHPDLIAYFNVASGGPGRADRLLVDSNLDWGQGLVQLREWMAKGGVERINLSYFGSVDPAIYGVRAIPLEGSPPAAGAVRPPELPGYVAVGITNLRGEYLAPGRRGLYQDLLAREPVAVIAHAIRVYRVDRAQ